MKYSEFETIKHFEEMIRGMKLILRINKGLRFVGLGSSKIEEQEIKLKDLENNLKELKETPQKFNDIFSERGWIAYDGLNHNLMIEMIKTYESEGMEKAEERILEYYKAENLKYECLRLRAVPELQRRLKYIDYAKNDYEEERFYSTIPLLLMIIDGTVNDIAGRGFHTDTANIDVWDALTNIDKGIEKIREIFRTGRNKTREEELTLPYRNGILHGMDLGYDNYIVAAKCWHFLFVVRDWALSRHSEDKRKNEFLKSKNPPSIIESLNKLKEIEAEKAALRDWRPRDISDNYLNNLNQDSGMDRDLPETIVMNFLGLWKKKNYGYIANMYWSVYFQNGKPDVIEIKNQFREWELDRYLISRILDEAPGISEIDVDAFLVNKETATKFRFRLLYEGHDGLARSRNLGNGNWRIVSVQENAT